MLLGVPEPDPSVPDNTQNGYIFERAIQASKSDGSTTPNYIDLYKRECFVLETKQGVERQEAAEFEALSDAERKRRKKRKKGHGERGTRAYDRVMRKAHAQAQGYARALPLAEGRPPFIVVVDVGHSIELYSEFTRSGGTYTAFPDPQTFRILLKDLGDREVRERLAKLWRDPMDLDPSRRSARVTRDIAQKLALLAKSLESEGHDAPGVAGFLMRCLFTMFAEDVNLLPKASFTKLLEEFCTDPSGFKPTVEELWKTMNFGGFSVVLRDTLLQFNGGLFAEHHAFEVTPDQLELLIEAAKADWRDVEPAIFGTLLERALDPRERHKLGAHYTPRAYVERLVMPTIIEPLREEWEAVQAAAFTLADQDEDKKAWQEIHTFHIRLCNVRVLDPACGSGNFLYVTLEHLKRLEGEIFNTLAELGEKQSIIESEGVTVDPHQLLGIEINPRAAAIAEMVLWIGYLQWHNRTHGDVTPPEPIIRNFKNIECRDAVLAYDDKRIVIDPDTLEPKTHWDGRTTKPHPVTGEEVPDETAQVPEYEYINPRKAEWPEADYVVGNPPFIGTSKMRESLGDGYTITIRKTISDVPESSDYVMYWWDKAAELTRQQHLERFGLIATNSLKQKFNRRVLQRHLDAKHPISLAFAIPDHPWVDAADGAAVRISMTVGHGGQEHGKLCVVVGEESSSEDERNVTLSTSVGKINSDLTVGVDTTQAVPLHASSSISCPGVKLHGSGFIVTPDEAASLGLGHVAGIEDHIRQYRNGKDITQVPRGVFVIDCFGLREEDLQNRFPSVYQRLLDRVKPERDQNKRKVYREKWWIFGEPRAVFRPALNGLHRYIATVETSKHRFFVFLDKGILPDNMLVNIAVDDAYSLGVLSSRTHVTWALAQGGTLEDRPRYNKTRCFETFPFPEPADALRAHIRELGERLDAHRKARQAEHAKLTMTGMYNVLEKLRSEEALTTKEKEIYEQGLVLVLKEIHDELDAAVFEAYGWPTNLSDEEILERLVALNAERAAEEQRGVIRWLRPDYQNPEGSASTQIESDEMAAPAAKKKKASKREWPKEMAAQAGAIREALATLEAPASAKEIARSFKRARTERVEDLLETLTALGQCRQTREGLFIGP